MTKPRHNKTRKMTMFTKGLKIGSALLCIAAIPAISGCAHCRAGTRVTTVSSTSKCNLCHKGGCRGGCNDTTTFAPTPKVSLTAMADLPPNAKPGECYAKVFLPPEFETVTERICVREESERLEIVPAEYEWVEEQVVVKEASTELVAVAAQFEMQDRLVQTSPGHTTWVKQPDTRCVADNTQGPPPKDVFCLVSAPPTTLNVQAECLSKPATVEKVAVAAEYQTIRKQVCVKPATTRTIPIPAEFKEIEKTVMVTPGHMEWQRIECDVTADAANFYMEPQIRPVRDVNVELEHRDIGEDND